MKCPVCKTECANNTYCPECGFEQISPVFVNRKDADEWVQNVVWPFRRKYWKTLEKFEISEQTVSAYMGFDSCVNIPYGIEVIGDNAFEGKKMLQKVNLPSTVKHVEFNAFCASGLSEISLPNTLESIDLCAFSDTQLSHISIPGSCKIVQDEAFLPCKNLKSVEIFEGVQTLKRYAFASCPNLLSISLPKSLLNIEEGALSTGCPSTKVTIHPENPRYYAYGNCIIDRATHSVIAGFSGDNHVLSIPDLPDITHIAPCAYEGQQQYSLLIVSESIESIGHRAFGDCGAVQAFIPASVSRMGNHVFNRCSGVVFCDAKYRPDGWSSDWNGNYYSNEPIERTVHWKL